MCCFCTSRVPSTSKTLSNQSMGPVNTACTPIRTQCYLHHRTSNSQHLGSTSGYCYTQSKCSDQTKLPAVPTNATDTCQHFGPYSYPPHCSVLPWTCGTLHLSPYPAYATAHTMAQHLDLALACQMQTQHERGPDPHKKLTPSTNTGLWRATDGFHS